MNILFSFCSQLCEYEAVILVLLEKCPVLKWSTAVCLTHELFFNAGMEQKEAL